MRRPKSRQRFFMLLHALSRDWASIGAGMERVETRDRPGQSTAWVRQRRLEAITKRHRRRIAARNVTMGAGSHCSAQDTFVSKAKDPERARPTQAACSAPLPARAWPLPSEAATPSDSFLALERQMSPALGPDVDGLGAEGHTRWRPHEGS